MKSRVRENCMHGVCAGGVQQWASLPRQCNAQYGKIIDKVIIFGSAVTDSCTEESDIDVCLVSDYTTSNEGFFKVYGRLAMAMGDVCDVLNYRNMGNTLRGEVAKKGVTVYEYSPY